MIKNCYKKLKIADLIVMKSSPRGISTNNNKDLVNHMINTKDNTKNTIYNTLSALQFENSYMKSLIVKEVDNPKKSQTTRGCNYTRVTPTPLDNPRMISISPYCCKFLGLDYQQLKSNDNETAEYLSGNKLIESSEPVAHCYVGHQFGVLAGQLGDGRAITLGDLYGLDEEGLEQETNKNSTIERNTSANLWELQLKGAGLTPYSRFADGRAVLRSSIREYLCSEHLWSLGIPTTRALSLIGSDSTVQRDPLYSGNAIYEQCAVVCRIAPTFFRFGSFEIFKGNDSLSGSSGPSSGMEKEMLPGMLNYLGKYHFTKLYNECGGEEVLKSSNDKLKLFTYRMFELITIRTAILTAYWQTYGFCHGVLNTDNMSILGLTIDFGPFGFLEFFDNFFICNHSDKHGRYAYIQQPKVCKWNLGKLAEALVSILPESDAKAIIQGTYDKIHKKYYYLLTMHKLGLFMTDSINEADAKLVDELYDLLEDFGFDLTLFFRLLSNIGIDDGSSTNTYEEFLEKMVKYSLNISLKAKKIKPTINENAINQLVELKDLNPLLLYSYGLEPEFVENQLMKKEKFAEFKSKYNNSETFEAEKKSKLESWLKTYKERVVKEYETISNRFVSNESSKLMNVESLRKSWNILFDEEFLMKYPISKHAFNNKLRNQCDKVIADLMSAINSTNGDNNNNNFISSISHFNSYKKALMNNLNPKFILRNHIAQRVIEKAENGDYSELDKVFGLMTSPFDEHSEVTFEDEYDTSILLAYNICVSCSS